MDLIVNLINPISIIFIILVFGYYLGRIKIRGISLDLAGVLILAVVSGWGVSSNEIISKTIDFSTIKSNMQMVSSLGTAIFVSVIGITSGYVLDLRNLQNAKAILIGSMMVISSFALMNLISALDNSISNSKLLGALCGALTTTPGLSAATELTGVISEEVTVAYGCTYLLGVVAAVLSAQVFSQRSNTVVENEKKDVGETRCALDGLIYIAAAIVSGRLLGGIHVGSFTLGQSGGMLCTGIAVGVITKEFFEPRMASLKAMGIYRNLGLILFFVGNGFPAGMSLVNGFDFRIFLYGVLMTVTPISVGLVLSKLILNDRYASSIVAGGMTSTPAIGVILQKQYYVSLDCYSMAYVGALLTIILLIRTL